MRVTNYFFDWFLRPTSWKKNHTWYCLCAQEPVSRWIWRTSTAIILVKEYSSIILVKEYSNKMTDSILLYPLLCPSLNLHWRNFSLLYKVINTETHNWTMCRVRDFRVLSSKWEVFIKPLPLRLFTFYSLWKKYFLYICVGVWSTLCLNSKLKDKALNWDTTWNIKLWISLIYQLPSCSLEISQPTVKEFVFYLHVKESNPISNSFFSR